MKILDVQALTLSEVKIVRMQRYRDDRGYFIEAFRDDVITQLPELSTIKDKKVVQINESQSRKKVVRGLHTQSEPNLDKMLRVLNGRIIDVAVDIRPNSPTFGQAAAYELKYEVSDDFEEFIFIPFGFAHGFMALEDARVQYFQTGLWNSEGEATINFMDPTIDWSGCDPNIKEKIQMVLKDSIFSEKDKTAASLADWKSHPLSQRYQM